MRFTALLRVWPIVTALLFLASSAAQTQFSTEDAYNPIPSPDGRKIVAVRTGWHRPGGSGGLGRSNLRSDLIILNRTGHLLSPKPIADSFAADWTADGIVAFRDWSYRLISEDGSIRQQGRVCPQELVLITNSGCVERVAYLSAGKTFVWVRQKFGDSVLVTPGGELSAHHHKKYLGEWIVASPDERYIAVGPGHLGRTLDVYDLREKTWIEFGSVVIHPAVGWDWMEPSWSPWFADSSQLAVFTSEGLIISSPDGQRKRTVLHTQEPAGLAVPSPDGHAIAYATFASRPRSNGAGSTPVWNCTGLWVVDLQKPTPPRRLTASTPSLTYDLRWLDNQSLVFDRVEEGFPPKAQLWKVALDR